MNSQTSISFEYLEYAFLVDQENTACKKTIKTAQIQWTIGEPAAELFRRDRKLFQQDELFDKLPNNIDDPVQWFEFRRQIIEIKKRCGLTMYVNALNALLKNYDKPSALMYFVMAMLLHFRYDSNSFCFCVLLTKVTKKSKKKECHTRNVSCFNSKKNQSLCFFSPGFILSEIIQTIVIGPLILWMMH